MKTITSFICTAFMALASAQLASGSNSEALENETSSTPRTYYATITSMTDDQYPHNNAIGFKSTLAGQYSHNGVEIIQQSNGLYTLNILPGNDNSDSIRLMDVNLLEFMPSIPSYVKNDEYLTHLSLLNQEWNRIQVKYPKEQYVLQGAGTEDAIISRMDVANNCLAKGLWEIIFFTKENGNDLVYFQCWFNFPEELYNDLFKQRNGVAIDRYNDVLINYKKMPARSVALSELRTVISEENKTFRNLNNELYPLKGERQTKAKNIVYPIAYASINDFLTDDTKFATFASPGMYTRDDPRATQLSRFGELQNILFCNTVSRNGAGALGVELQLTFQNVEHTNTTKLVVGGLDLSKVPVLAPQNLHQGFQKPMGIANHSFYNSVADINGMSSLESPYFAMLLDENNVWLDSHEIGVDGALYFKEEGNENLLHILLLGFERHAFVGHFVINISE